MARTDDSRQPGGDGKPQRITALDIQQKEFRVSFRGYNEREVDEFLDLVTEELARLHSENKRLQEQSDYRQTLPLGGEAEEVLGRAKEEAERIVAEARSRAASMAGSPRGPGGPPLVGFGFDATEAVNRYLAREREFLQSLASRIHQHIEAVKGDAREMRAAAEGAPAERSGGAHVASAGYASELPSSPEAPSYEAPPATDAPSGSSRGDLPDSASLEAEPGQVGGAGEASPPEGDEDGPPTQQWDSPPVARADGGSSAIGAAKKRGVTETMPRVLVADQGNEELGIEGLDGEVSPGNGRLETVRPETMAGAAAPPDDPRDERSLRELFWGED